MQMQVNMQINNNEMEGEVIMYSRPIEQLTNLYLYILAKLRENSVGFYN